MFYLYRKSSGEVLGVSTASYGAVSGALAEVSSVTVVDLSTPHVYLSSTLRPATAPEIAGFAAHRTADQLQEEKTSIKSLFDGTSTVGSILVKAVMMSLMDEINLLRTAVGQPTRTAAQIRTTLRNNIDAIT